MNNLNVLRQYINSYPNPLDADQPRPVVEKRNGVAELALKKLSFLERSSLKLGFGNACPNNIINLCKEDIKQLSDREIILLKPLLGELETQGLVLTAKPENVVDFTTQRFSDRSTRLLVPPSVPSHHAYNLMRLSLENSNKEMFVENKVKKFFLDYDITYNTSTTFGALNLPAHISELKEKISTANDKHKVSLSLAAKYILHVHNLDRGQIEEPHYLTMEEVNDVREFLYIHEENSSRVDQDLLPPQERVFLQNVQEFKEVFERVIPNVQSNPSYMTKSART